MTEQESPYFGKHLTHSIQLQAFPPMKNGKLWGFLWTQIQGVLSTPPPKKKKKTAVFVAFFLGGGFQHTMAEADESILDFVIHQHDMKREVPASRIQNARSRSKEMYVVLNANQSTWI